MKHILAALLLTAAVAFGQPTLANSDDITAAKARANHTGTQPHTTITGLGTAATAASTDFADDGALFYAARYGVLADGTTDDRIALQAAINAAAAVATASTRATVILPAGKIMVSRATVGTGYPLPPSGIPNPASRPYWKFCVLLKNNVNVIGQGIDATTIQVITGTIEDTSVLFSDDLPIGNGGTGFSENITLKNLTIDSNATARAVFGEGEGINIKTAKNLLIQGVRVKNAEQDGFDVDGGYDTTLDGCIAEDCQGNGVHIVSGGNERPRVLNSRFMRNGYVRRSLNGGNLSENGSGVDLAANNALISNCMFENNAVAVQFLGGSAMMEGCAIEHNPTSLNLPAIVSGWGWTGVEPFLSGTFEIRNCKINPATGVPALEIIRNFPRTIIEGCEVKGRIVCTSGKDLILTGNYISTGTSNVAVTLTLQTGKFTAQGNVFEDCANDIVVTSSSNGRIIGNTFMGSNVAVNMSSTVDTLSNWEIIGNVFDSAGGVNQLRLLSKVSNATVANNVGSAGGFNLYIGGCPGNKYINNLFANMAVEGGLATGNLFERNAVTGTISHSGPTFASNTWRKNTGAGCAGIFYGTATLTSGAATVSTAAANSSRKFGFSRQAPNSSTAIGNLALGTVTAQTSFVVNALNDTATVATGDLSSVYWEILE